MELLTEQEAMARDKRNWQLIRHGCFFDFGGERFFIATREIDNETWEVIELTPKNRERLIQGLGGTRTFVKLSNAYSYCLNLH
ncbi:hypothetical protein A2482_01865 [Candidatus Falkowbacteria bacterium RIFOXYC2_FULL_48_21]|uniref:Uncharacterized protein n=1 Tax=Candidatus Falkowbacteria bacterium RIFOXYC2_FULL_48_21 TaxID=1798005 RepID=A0A1F5TFK9_9BACT|nr:MAG: hypothetical protein A2482_01865 [Candidatus Falkowbacteria bacterium RIFOXYC2_FULL_48_21]